MTPTARPTRTWSFGAVLLLVVALLSTGCGSESNDDSPFGAEPSGQAADRGSGDEADGPTGGDDPSASGTALPRFDPEAEDTARGMTIPEVSGQTHAGEPITIGPDGTAKVIVFVAHWCPHCQNEVPRIVEHLDGDPLPDDVELYGVSTSINPSAPNHPPEAWLEAEGWTFPTLADTDNSVATQFGLSAFPYFVAVDAEGAVVARGSGELSTDQFDQLVEAARTGSL